MVDIIFFSTTSCQTDVYWKRWSHSQCSLKLFQYTCIGCLIINVTTLKANFKSVLIWKLPDMKDDLIMFWNVLIILIYLFFDEDKETN